VAELETSSEGRDDAALLAAVAQHRDRDAFAELIRRHERSAYSLAVHITGKSGTAEDAVQDALLRVWLTAQTFRGEGTVRAWILRIVAGKSLEAVRRKQARDRATLKERDRAARLKNEAPADVESRGELLDALRAALQELPFADRQLLAMHYGGGLTHNEIGSALAMPRRTVSHRIEEALQGLRNRMESMGLAVSLPIASSGVLNELFCSGWTAPTGLCESMVEATLSAAQSERLVAASGKLGSIKLWAAAALCVGVAATVGALTLSGKNTPVAAPTKASAPPATHVPLKKLWRFDQNRVGEFKFLEGSAHWQAPANGRVGYMVFSSEAPPYMVVPVEIKAPNFVIRIKCRTSSLKLGGISTGWTDGPADMERRRWPSPKNLTVNLNQTYDFHFYFKDVYLLPMLKDKYIGSLVEVRRKPEMKYVAITAVGWAIEEIELCELTEAELPEQLRDVETFKASLGSVSDWYTDKFVPPTHLPNH